MENRTSENELTFFFIFCFNQCGPGLKIFSNVAFRVKSLPIPGFVLASSFEAKLLRQYVSILHWFKLSVYYYAKHNILTIIEAYKKFLVIFNSVNCSANFFKTVSSDFSRSPLIVMFSGPEEHICDMVYFRGCHRQYT